MPAIDSSALTNVQLKVDGQDAGADILDNLLEVLVDHQVRLPSMFVLKLMDDDLALMNSARLDIGKSVTITVEAAGYGKYEKVTGQLISGEITSLEPDFATDGTAVLVVRGYDKLHRLHRGRHTRTFLGVTDADVVARVASEAGLSAKTETTSGTHAYVLQHNQTDLEFIQARAARHGYQVFVSDGTLNFLKADSTLGDGPTVTRGDDLLSFQPRLASARQADKVQVRGWDALGKKEIVAEATPAAPAHQAGVTDSGGKTAAKAFGSAQLTITDRPVANVDEAKAMATGEAAALSAAFLQADGSCLGDPRILAGHTLQVDGVGTRYSGKYVVTSATHVIRSGEPYVTNFIVTGSDAGTVSELLSPPAEPRGTLGVVTGLVTSLTDPESLGRVKLKFPWLGDSVESDWVRLATPSAGGDRGFAFLPEVNDEVLVAFEHGDVHRPYILGGLWNQQDKPAQADELVDGDKVVRRVIKSRSGHVIILDDSDGDEKIIIRDKTGENEIEIASADKTLNVKIGGDVTLQAEGEITLKSRGKDITLDCNNLNLKAKQNVSMEASSAIEIKANAKCTVEGTAGVTVKAAVAQVALSGPSVNINNGALEVI